MPPAGRPALESRLGKSGVVKQREIIVTRREMVVPEREIAKLSKVGNPSEQIHQGSQSRHQLREALRSKKVVRVAGVEPD